MSVFRRTVAGAIVALTGATAAWGADRLWIEPLGGFWDTPDNWMDGIVPVLGDAAVFDIGDSLYPVVSLADLDIDRLVVGTDDVAFDLQFNTLSIFLDVDENTASLAIGDAVGDDGTVVFSKGLVQSVYASIGTVDGASGDLTFSGLLTDWLNTKWTVIGNAGVGTLTFENAATGLNGPCRVGLQSTGDGTVFVTGAGTHWDNFNALIIGVDGVGAVDVSGEGAAEAGNTILGQNAGSSGALNVDGAGSTFEARGALTIGGEGVGTVSISAGGEVIASSCAIAPGGAGNGQLTISGGGSQLNVTNTLDIGAGGPGVLYHTGGGINAQLINVGVGPTADGELQIQSSGSIIASSIVIGGGGVLSGSGVMQGTLSNAGVVRIGDPIGTISILGDYDQTGGLGGLMFVDIKGISPGVNHDRFNAAGTATLGGRLTVTFDPTHTPVNGNSYVILEANSISGTFSVESFQGLPAGLVADVQYSPTQVAIVISGVPGDLTGDGVVDGADLAVLLAAWGPCPAPCPPDFTGDGQVGGADLATLLAAWT